MRRYELWWMICAIRREDLVSNPPACLREFEMTCRLAMEQAAAQPPFPAGVALTHLV
jgi:hypothetical protein